MSRETTWNRLGTQLVAAALCCALTAGLLFWGLDQAAYLGLNRYLTRENVGQKKEQAYLNSLKRYVAEHDLSLDQVEQLDDWTRNERYLLVMVYRDGRLIYSNDPKISSLQTAAGDGALDAQTDLPWTYEVQFADGTANVDLYYFFESAYYTVADALCGAVAVAFFVVLMFALIRRKMRYIALLEREMGILKGGDLDYPITVKGNDELASLAAEMDAMRRAVRQRMEREEEARQANRELVTAMSHDLRTPLTSLLGYVDILQMDKLTDEGQRKRCLEAVRQKAYQIKELSDKLFEYFIVYGREQESLETELVNGAEFLGQVVEESLFDLESEGFEVLRSSDEIDCALYMDVALIRRVFGNIFSNLLKYGDRSRPLEVEYRQGDGELLIRFKNSVNRHSRRAESSGIGIKTCRKIMEDHGGRFECRGEGGTFAVEVTFVTGRGPVEGAN